MSVPELVPENLTFDQLLTLTRNLSVSG
jgi:hypothetical protein